MITHMIMHAHGQDSDFINQSINCFNVHVPGQDDPSDGCHSITQTKTFASYARPVSPLLKGLISGSLNSHPSHTYARHKALDKGMGGARARLPLPWRLPITHTQGWRTALKPYPEAGSTR